MGLDLDGTMVAVSSGIAPARRGIVRLSGASTRMILSKLLAPANSQQQAAKQALLDAPHACCDFLPARIGLGDRTLKLWCYYWPNARSFTGEPCAELHVLGSLPIIESLVESVCALGARPADRGEFTLRSFLAGKIDLTQAEAVLGVIEADSDDELAQALGQLSGNLSGPVRSLRDSLLELTAHVEAGLDFVEEDIEFIASEDLHQQLGDIGTKLAEIIQQLRSRGSRTRTPQVILVGAPNAGKSSLFNALAGKPRVIVSPHAGTTRDAVSQRISCGGLEIELVDTAGIEELHDQTPRCLAQQALKQRVGQADLIVFCVDLSLLPDVEWLRAHLENLRQNLTPLLMVATKRDLVSRGGGLKTQLAIDALQVDALEPLGIDGSVQAVSVHDATSLESLRLRIAQTISESTAGMHTEAMHRTMVRCSSRLAGAVEAIDRATALIHEPYGEELVAAELRLAIEDMSSVIGEVHTEDILGEIFSRFCIGK